MRRWLNQPMASANTADKIPPLADQDKFEVTSLLCASNNLIIAALVGVLLFQAAQAYTVRKVDKEITRMANVEKKEAKSL